MPENTQQQGLDVVSLFAGVGGIDLAARQAGMRTLLACEVDEPARRVLAARFPDAVLHSDVRTLTADDLYRAGAQPERTVVTAGFPCQDLSVAGNRRGMGEGTRSGLYWHVDRLLGEFRPAWVVLENVPGLLSAACACPGDGTCVDRGLAVRCSDDGGSHAVTGGVCWGECIARHGGVLGAVLGSLAERGYGFAYRVLDARHFGVPQRRRRVVIVGHLGDTGTTPVQILLEPESLHRDSSPRREKRTRATRPIRSGYAVGVLGEHAHTLTGEGADAGEDGSGRGTSVIAFAWQAGGNNSASGAFTDDGTTPTLPKSQTLAISYAPDEAATITAGTSSKGVSAPGRRQEDDSNLIAYVPEVAHSLMAHGGNDKHDPTMMTYVAHEAGTLTAGGGDRGYRIDAESAAAGHLIAEPLAVHENQRGELNLTDTAALTSGGGKPGQGYPAVTDGVIVRRLSPLECERLQGFPDGWTAIPGTSDSQRYKQLGNSVAVPVFAWVLGRLAAVANADSLLGAVS